VELSASDNDRAPPPLARIIFVISSIRLPSDFRCWRLAQADMTDVRKFPATTPTPRNEQASTALPSQTWRSPDVRLGFGKQRSSMEFNNVEYAAGQTGWQASPTRPEGGSARPKT
jgi:hypothetical protein